MYRIEFQNRLEHNGKSATSLEQWFTFFSLCQIFQRRIGNPSIHEVLTTRYKDLETPWCNYFLFVEGSSEYHSRYHDTFRINLEALKSVSRVVGIVIVWGENALQILHNLVLADRASRIFVKITFSYQLAPCLLLSEWQNCNTPCLCG